jgi:hypothetical protein
VDTRTFAAAQSHNRCGNATAINEDEFLKKIDTPGINYYSPILNSQQASDEFYKYLMDHDPQIKAFSI